MISRAPRRATSSTARDHLHRSQDTTRVKDATRQYWTLAHVDGRRYLDRPVYIFTSGTTFSGAEEIAYNLKAQKRATLIGETTLGGAHPSEWYPLTPHITVTIPNARSINPVTGTNWEGVGIEPDVAVSADEAFDVAYRHARDEVSSG
ncbi:S41 family peptidase [Catenulispora sp. NF23]|uniref:S41 family peptidase n=1 Tax=Catenulispora pinistramenti TaxID=2705254 RepID=A0ABS5KWP8_9ACTN|nr:S41 family peptidase [Catenulispora pinistramenti]MBS2534444.1 S41 family peptidase [Catenulispora pinistramenti]MBS2550380.1 S41 family peptidase [Catenulispora pinistramenti]